MSKPAKEQPWGRVLIAGGTEWATNGQKGRSNAAVTDLIEPHILRSLSHIKMAKVLTGCSANYGIALDVHGMAHIFGKVPASGLGPMQPKNIVPHDDPIHITPHSVGLKKGAKFVDGAAGRSHFFLLDSEGGVWGCGNNVVGQLGMPVCVEVPTLTQIRGPWVRQKERIVQVSAGQTFSLFLSDTGTVYACGSSEHGQLGNGTTGERLITGGKRAYDVQVPPRPIQGELEGKRVVQISSGNQHSLALDEEGYVYGWGFNGYARLGLGDQKDRLVPTLIPQFCDHNELKRAGAVYCGPTNSVVIDRLKLFHMAGKWKLTGDGSTGSPYTSFKHLDGLSGCRVVVTALGGCTHFITTPTDTGDTMTVGWGQGALYGELGFGPDFGKSNTKPQEIVPLRGADVIDIAAGCFFTLFLAQPNAALSELQRYPEHVESANVCLVCHTDKGDDDPALECERCDEPYHPGCLDPPLEEIPEGEWFCPVCEDEATKLGRGITPTTGADILDGEYEVEERPELGKRRSSTEEVNGSKKPRAE